MLAVAKLAMSALGFLKGPVGKFVSIVLIAITLWGGFQWWLARHDAGIRDAALTEFNIAQEEIAEKMRLEFEQRMRETLDAQVELIDEITREREELQRKADTLIRVIRSGNLQGGEASEVLRGTIQMLQERAHGGAE